IGAGLADNPGRSDRAGDECHAAYLVPVAKDADHALGGVDAILQRDHRGPRTDDRADLLGDPVDIPQFDAGQNHIDDADAGDIVGGLRRPDNGLAAIPFDAQPVLAHRREMCAARNEGHIRPGLGERGAIAPADTAGADHGDAHPLLLTSRSARSSEAAPWPSPARRLLPPYSPRHAKLLD